MRNISAVCPPEPRTIRILADDFRDGGGCGRKAGRIHISRITDIVSTASRMERMSLTTEWIDGMLGSEVIGEHLFA